jgi:hypothetical protein
MSSPWGEETGEGGRKNKWIGADAKRSRKSSSRICKPASGMDNSEGGALRRPGLETGTDYWGSWNSPLRIRGRETLKEKLKPYLQTGEWSE